MPPQLGDSYFTIASDRAHLWVIISDPELNSEKVALVNLTDRKNNKDGTCILSIGDHPYITKETDVFYGRAKFMQRSVIQSACDAGHTHQRERFCARVLNIIQRGAIESKHTPRGIKALLLEQRGYLGF